MSKNITERVWPSKKPLDLEWKNLCSQLSLIFYMTSEYIIYLLTKYYPFTDVSVVYSVAKLHK